MRLLWLDLLKGISIVLVVGYHLLFDLDHFVGIPIDTEAWYWSLAAFPILAVFIGGAGVSLVLSSFNKTERTFRLLTIKKTAYLCCCALAVTAVTTSLFPDEAILFGVLHLIAVSRLVGMFFVQARRTALITGLAVLAVTPLVTQLPVQTHAFIWLGVVPDNFSSLDYFPLFPWFGIFCIGMFLGQMLPSSWSLSWDVKNPGLLGRTLIFLGRHTLLLYLVHQPVILGMFWFFGFMRL
ncbi:MAG: DUF1624 domain-containing protein [Candidatus Dependentiae bacterium]|nr:DUF1624 domain-containing protein [Candidatus Dependentiae bacterium]